MPRNRSEKEFNLDAPLVVAQSGNLLFNGTTQVIDMGDDLSFTFAQGGTSVGTDVVLSQGIFGEVREYSVEVRAPEYNNNYEVYEVDNGVQYWYFCESMAHAIAAHFRQLADEGLHDDDIDAFTIERISRDRAEQLGFHDDTGQRECNMYEAGLKYGPGFIACSEY